MTMVRLDLAAVLLASGCAFTWPLDDQKASDSGARIVVLGDTDSAERTPGTTYEPPEPCHLVAAASLPAPDEPNAYYRDPIRFRLSDIDTRANIRVVSSEGIGVDGTTAPRIDDPTVIEFQPDAPLEPGTQYHVQARYCNLTESLSWSFTVGPAGQPLTCDLPHTTFQMDLATARWFTPEGLGGAIPLLVESDLLVGITEEDGDLVSARVAAGAAGSQDFCHPTSNLPPAERSGPDLFRPATSATLLYADHVVTLHDWRVEATVLPDCSGVAGGRTRGRVDLRELAPLVSFEDTPVTAAGLCAFLETYSTTCEPCDDGEAFCMAFDVEGVSGTALDAPLTCVGAASCHPECAASTCDDPTAGICEG